MPPDLADELKGLPEEDRLRIEKEYLRHDHPVEDDDDDADDDDDDDDLDGDEDLRSSGYQPTTKENGTLIVRIYNCIRANLHMLHCNIVRRSIILLKKTSLLGSSCENFKNKTKP